MIYSHIRYVKDFPQGLLTPAVLLHQVCSGEAIVVLVLSYLKWKDVEMQVFPSSFNVNLIVPPVAI